MYIYTAENICKEYNFDLIEYFIGKDGFTTLDFGTITVALFHKDGFVRARGISICSPTDHYNSDMGLEYAARYVKRVLAGRSPHVIKNYKAIRQLLRCRADFTFHAYKNPKPTLFEKSLITSNKKAIEGRRKKAIKEEIKTQIYSKEFTKSCFYNASFGVGDFGA